MKYLNTYRIGVHLSKKKNLVGFLEQADALGINTFACFTAPNLRYSYTTDFQKKDYDAFITCKKKLDYLIFSHACYLINLADTQKAEIYNNSIRALEAEITRCHKLDIHAVAFHPGSNPSRQQGLENIAHAINHLSVLNQGETILCIESSAGQGNTLPTTFEEMAYLDSLLINKKKVGFTLDICHLFAAGYDLSSAKKVNETLKKCETLLGFDRVIFIHLNDSKKSCGSHLDRHETLCKGNIGEKGIEAILSCPQLKHIPKILETPVNSYTDWIPELHFINDLYGKI